MINYYGCIQRIWYLEFPSGSSSYSDKSYVILGIFSNLNKLPPIVASSQAGGLGHTKCTFGLLNFTFTISLVFSQTKHIVQFIQVVIFILNFQAKPGIAVQTPGNYRLRIMVIWSPCHHVRIQNVCPEKWCEKCIYFRKKKSGYLILGNMYSLVDGFCGTLCPL